ncbi:FAS1 domain-containing protein fsc1 [Choanephora cucurbitarum]|uniref:FAS1 domain-containing protein fsc1 n=1 Tax=Choanephora cucurbitarum TaxID=101091 RepID=A0A1C7NID1_9FUNG|nr:FAS1 domain-containing protein fsc1 [Choanephora cucurbitarum]
MNTYYLTLIFAFTFLSGIHAYKTIVDVLSEDARFSTLIRHLQLTHLIPKINNLESGTFFAPDNSAFEKYKGPPITADILMYHLLPQQFSTKDFGDGQILESSYVRPGLLGDDKTGQKLKVTTTFDMFYHINEARIKDKDIFVNRNTTLNVVDRVLEPPRMLYEMAPIYDSKLFDLWKKAGLDNNLRQRHPFTIFVSAKYLLDRFSHVEQSYLTSHYGQDDLKHALKYLMVPQAIFLNQHKQDETIYMTESGETVKINVNRYKQATVNGIKVEEQDILAADGVIHILNDLPYADSIVFDTRKYLFGLNATKFVSLIDSYGLGRFLNKGTNNVTILAPTNEVIDEDSIPNNQKTQWLSYHLVQGAYSPSELTDRMLVKTEFNSSQLYNDSQRLFVSIGKSKEDTMENMNAFIKSIRFGDYSKVVGVDMAIDGNVIYRISDPLALPMDIFSRLVVDLELSSFIATLYVSGVVDRIKRSKAITLFAPTNQAFKNLGLVSRYLVHPTGRSDLQRVLLFHAATSPLYHHDLRGDVLRVTTLAENESLIINGQNADGSIWIGTETKSEKDAEGNTVDEHGVIQQSDMLVSNGVVHKIDHIQIPNHVNITHRNLLRGINANIMLNILRRTNLIDQLDMTDNFLLAPTDKAFEHIDLEPLWNDTAKLERIARMHIVPKVSVDNSRKRWFIYPFLGDQEYSTLLSNRDKIVVREMGYGLTVIRVKGEPYSPYVRVLDIGHVSTGDRSGGVVEIDAVLFPVKRGAFGLPWIWSLVTLTLLSALGALVFLIGGCMGYKMWKRKRAGYQTIADDSTLPDQSEQANA